MRSRTVTALALALVVSPWAGSPASAQVTPGDISRAEEQAAHAGRMLDDARRDLAAAEQELRRLEARLGALRARSDEISRQREGLIVEARRRVARLYMTAGERVMVGDPFDLSARIAYLVAVSEDDVSTVNELLVRRGDLDRVEETSIVQLSAQQDEVMGLELLVAARAAVLGQAESRVAEIRAQFRVQEEERRRREESERRRRLEEERRRQEELERAEAAARAAVEDARENAERWGYTRGAGVEQWRPLVMQYFPPSLIDDALSVMACESHGDPFAENPFTGAGGLFQHMPFYWPYRAANAGFEGKSVFHPEANVAASAWLVEVSTEDGGDPWAHWNCRP